MSAALGTAGSLAGTDFRPPELGVPRQGHRHAGPAAERDRAHQAVAVSCRVFAAQPLQVAYVRRFVGGVLSGLGADDVVLCVSELASNAVLHSSSGKPGGQFIVRVGMSGTGRVRAEVEDLGGPWAAEPDTSEEFGRGLRIVGALASRWGITGGDAGRVAWLELDLA
jgi:serine/threonine-protein kinase RsbW